MDPDKIFIEYAKPKKGAGVFWQVSEGLLSAVHMGRNNGNTVKVLDGHRRTPLHYSAYLNLDPMSLYFLLCGLETTALDQNCQSVYHVLMAKGSVKALQIILNFEIHTLRKELYEWIILLKFGISMKSITLRNTIASYLSKSLNLNKLPTRPIESKIELQGKLEEFFRKVLEKYKFVLIQQDKFKRTCVHYAALSKFTWCFKALENALKEIGGFEEFSKYFKEVSPLVFPSAPAEADKYSLVLEEVEKVLGAEAFSVTFTSFKDRLKNLKTVAVNIRDVNGQTPLHLACFAGDCKIVQLLMSSGADKSIKDQSGKSPLDLCTTKLVMRYLDDLTSVVQSKDISSMQHLVNSGYSVNDSKNQYMLNSMHLAVMGGSLLSAVLNSQGDVNSREWNLYTPLHYASMLGNLSDIKSLLTEGSNVSALSQHDYTPLHLAAHYNKVLAIQELLKNSANINAKDYLGRTPLMLASKYGCKAAVEELLISRCDMALCDQRGWNALHYASFHNKSQVVKLLVKWDSDENILVKNKNSQGKTPCGLSSTIKTTKAFDSNS